MRRPFRGAVFAYADNGYTTRGFQALANGNQAELFRRTPLIAGVIQNLVNLILDVALVGVFAWGVRGAAIAISIAQVCVIWLGPSSRSVKGLF